jgi:hypothetical protein
MASALATLGSWFHFYGVKPVKPHTCCAIFFRANITCLVKMWSKLVLHILAAGDYNQVHREFPLA